MEQGTSCTLFLIQSISIQFNSIRRIETRLIINHKSRDLSINRYDLDSAIKKANHIPELEHFLFFYNFAILMFFTKKFLDCFFTFFLRKEWQACIAYRSSL